MDRLSLLKKLQSYNFAAYDMLLFLDTHPEDKNAFSIFRDLVQATSKLKKDYEAEYGPLTQFGAAGFSTFEWLDSPWPWEKEANK